MKTIILIVSIVLAGINGFAGDPAYEKEMQQNIRELSKANSQKDILAVCENFKMIAKDRPEEWLPYYYVSFSYLSVVFSEGFDGNIDETLDLADKYLAMARTQSPENAEIEVMQGWIYQGRIQADPMGRGMTYSQKASSSFGKAMNIDPENPRIYFLTGMNVLYTPEMFGGGKEAACPYFIKAMEKYKTFRPASSIAPDWGREDTYELAKSCDN